MGRVAYAVNMARVGGAVYRRRTYMEARMFDVGVLGTLPPAELTLQQVLALLAEAGERGMWGVAALALALSALLVFLSVEAVRRVVIRWLPSAWAVWVRTDRAGVFLSVLAGQLGALVVAGSNGQPITVAMLLGVLSSLLASGGKSWKRKAAPAPSAAPAAVEPRT